LGVRYSVDIDEVVLHGFGTVDRHRISVGLTEELSRLLTRDGLPRNMAARDQLDAGGIDIVPGDDRATGRNLGRSVHAGLRT
jgi:hypothetical protein